MTRDYQKEYNDLYKEYLEYTETVDESTKDQSDMNKFYNEYILKYQSKRDYIVDYMNKVVADAKAEGIKIKERPIKYYKIKRSEIMDDIEDRDGKISKFTTIEQCDKSIDDNQKKIDKLKDEIAQLEYYIKVAEKKKSELKNKKRSENMDNIEERALKTEDDYQKEFDKLNSNAKKLLRERDSIQSELDKIETKLTALSDEINKLQSEAKSKGFKIKRSEENDDLETRKKEIVANLTNLEERKNAILDNLEYRALKTQDDYQKELENLNDKAYKFYISAVAQCEQLYSYLKDVKRNAEKVFSEGKKLFPNLKDSTIKNIEFWIKKIDL